MASRLVYILYGSQTGNSESIAKDIHQNALSRGIEAVCKPLNDFSKLSPPLDQAACAIIICSTTGNGDAPENADKFWRHIRKRTHPKTLMASAKYTVLGLGDTNYDKFCNISKGIHTRMHELGASVMYPPAFADEATGLEDTVDPWVAQLWPALDAVLNPVSEAKDSRVRESNPEDDTPLQHADMGAQETKSDESTPLAQTIAEPILIPQYLTISSPEIAPLLDGIDITQPPPSQGIPRLRSTVVEVTPCAAEEDKKDGGVYDAEHPFLATVQTAKYLTNGGEAADRRVLWVKIDISGSGFSYEPGDSIGIYPPNFAADVEVVVSRLESAHGMSGSTCVSVSGGKCSTVEEVVRWGMDLCTPARKQTLRALADHCADERDRHLLLWLCSKAGSELYNALVVNQRLSVGELLRMVPSCGPSLGVLLGSLPPHAPRYYSVASTPLACPKSVCVCMSVLHYRIGDITRRGLCTTWLERCLKPWIRGENTTHVHRLKVFMKPTKDFRLPGSLRWPLILIGPGTGVAPFIGFLQHRYEQLKLLEHQVDEVCCGEWRGGYEVELKGEGSVVDEFRAREGRGEVHLFFGCRHPSEDFIFQSELQWMLDQHVLTTLETAFSRETDEKVYVQQKMLQRGEDLYRLIVQEDACIYVCGDGNNMAKDVHQCLKQILCTHTRTHTHTHTHTHTYMTDEEAESLLQDLKQRRRYLLDIWG